MMESNSASSISGLTLQKRFSINITQLSFKILPEDTPRFKGPFLRRPLSVDEVRFFLRTHSETTFRHLINMVIRRHFTLTETLGLLSEQDTGPREFWTAHREVLLAEAKAGSATRDLQANFKILLAVLEGNKLEGANEARQTLKDLYPTVPSILSSSVLKQIENLLQGRTRYTEKRRSLWLVCHPFWTTKQLNIFRWKSVSGFLMCSASSTGCRPCP